MPLPGPDEESNELDEIWLGPPLVLCSERTETSAENRNRPCIRTEVNND